MKRSCKWNRQEGIAMLVALFSLFFFQAEDGIRDSSVTGVQTCALPIYPFSYSSSQGPPFIFLSNLSRKTDGALRQHGVNRALTLATLQHLAGDRRRNRHDTR